MPAGLPRGSSYRPAWRFDLAKHFGGSDAKSGGHGAFDDPPDAAVVARLLQNTEEENVEDVDLALRAITYCQAPCRCLEPVCAALNLLYPPVASTMRASIYMRSK